MADTTAQPPAATEAPVPARPPLARARQAAASAGIAHHALDQCGRDHHHDRQRHEDLHGDLPIFGWLAFPNALTIGGDPDIAFRLHGNFGQSGACDAHFLGMLSIIGSMSSLI